MFGLMERSFLTKLPWLSIETLKGVTVLREPPHSRTDIGQRPGVSGSTLLGVSVASQCVRGDKQWVPSINALSGTARSHEIDHDGVRGSPGFLISYSAGV